MACDRCDAGAWIGAHGDAVDAWCEACQRARSVAPGDPDPRCATCAGPLTTGELRFEELYGELQNLAAVLDAWCGDVEPLDAILPERPRFLTDLNPPEPQAGDDPGVRAALAALARGAYAEARQRLEDPAVTAAGSDRTRVWRALGIACERLGELPLAEAAFSRALDHGEDAAVRLARGALRARRGEFEGAREDFSRAGDGREARWNRAALGVLEAVATTPGLPGRDALEAARAEAGPASPFWSDHTVGRLLWVLLVERAEGRAARDAPGCPDERVLRAAVTELEFETFWDRALVLLGFATLGMREDAATAARALANDLLAELRAEPFLRGDAARPIAEAIAEVARAVHEDRPDDARRALRGLRERDDVRHYRMPCARCGEGTVGVDRVEEDPASIEDEALR